MTDLPPGWVRITLEEMGLEAQPGFASGRHNRDGSGILHLRPMNVTREGRIDTLDARFVADQNGRRVNYGDIIFNNTNSPELVGKTALVNLKYPAAYSNHMTRLRCPKGIEPAFIACYLHFLWMTGYFRSVLSHHVNQASVSSKVLMQTSVPLPPSNEQQRIVATLDFYLSRLDEGLKGVVESKGRLRVLVSVLLAQALQGNYHGIDRDAVLPTRWEWVSIGDIADVGTGMTPLRSRQDYYADGTVPWVTSTLVNKPFIGEVKQYVTEKALVETSLKIWPKGTIVVAMYGEGQTRGRSSEMLIDATMNQACAAIVLKPQYENRRPWVKLALEANYERMRRLASGGVQPNLNLSLVRGIRIPLPPKEEQDRILSDVDEARSRQMRLGQALAAAEIRGKALRRALLTEAFAGRLVPQDPADEPASELLARIKAERAAQAKPQHARRTKSARPSVTGPTGSPVAPLTESQPAGRTEWPDVSCTPTTYEQGELL